MKTTKNTILSVAVLLTILLSNPAFAQMTSDSTAILRQAERWLNAAREENADSLIKVYSEDAVMLPPGAEPIKGKENIHGLFLGQFSSMDATYHFTTKELFVSGDWAYRWGNYEITAVTGSGEEVWIKDKFIEIWRRSSDGIWKITRDIWNRTDAIQ